MIRSKVITFTMLTHWHGVLVKNPCKNVIKNGMADLPFGASRRTNVMLCTIWYHLYI